MSWLRFTLAGRARHLGRAPKFPAVLILLRRGDSGCVRGHLSPEDSVTASPHLRGEMRGTRLLTSHPSRPSQQAPPQRTSSLGTPVLAGDPVRKGAKDGAPELLGLARGGPPAG